MFGLNIETGWESLFGRIVAGSRRIETCPGFNFSGLLISKFGVFYVISFTVTEFLPIGEVILFSFFLVGKGWTKKMWVLFFGSWL